MQAQHTRIRRQLRRGGHFLQCVILICVSQSSKGARRVLLHAGAILLSASIVVYSMNFLLFFLIVAWVSHKQPRRQHTKKPCYALLKLTARFNELKGIAHKVLFLLVLVVVGVLHISCCCALLFTQSMNQSVPDPHLLSFLMVSL